MPTADDGLKVVDVLVSSTDRLPPPHDFACPKCKQPAGSPCSHHETVPSSKASWVHPERIVRATGPETKCEPCRGRGGHVTPERRFQVCNRCGGTGHHREYSGGSDG